MKPKESDIDALVAAVRNTSKYRHVTPQLVQRLGLEELQKRRNLKLAVKATKSRLHQVAGAYLREAPAYHQWLTRLKDVADEPGAVRRECRIMMKAHVSSRERLPILEEFYQTIFSHLPPISSVLDLACGLNPLAIPWMPLPAHASYHAFDIYEDLVLFLDETIALMGLKGSATALDIACDLPAISADVAFVIKALPCLRHLNREIGELILTKLTCPHLVVSFPMQSISGSAKGMEQNYAAMFDQLIKDTPWRAKRLLFGTEQVFVLQR